MKRIRVCIFSFAAYPLFNPDYAHVIHGGAEVDSYVLASSLARDTDFDIHFIVGDFGQPKIEHYDDITLHRTFSIRKDLKYLRYPLAASGLLRLCHQIGAELYFQESAGIVTGLIALYCKISGKKFVYRTASNNHCNGEFMRRNPLAGCFYRYGLLNAHCVITQNRSQQEKFQRSLGVGSCVIHNAMPLPKDYNKVVRGTILWVGRLVDCKRPMLFLDLVRSFPDENFVMLGSGDSKYVEQMTRASRELCNFQYLSQVPFRKTDKYFRAAKILVNTSSSEGFPNTFVQSVANSTPILSIKVNPNEVLSREKIGYCCDDSFSRMVKFLRGFLRHPDLQQYYRRRSFEYACKYHDLNVVSKRYKELFQHVISHRKHYRKLRLTSA